MPLEGSARPSQTGSSCSDCRKLRCIHEVVAALSVAQTSDDVARVIVSQVVPALGTDNGHLFLPSPDGKRLVMVQGKRATEPAALGVAEATPVTEAYRRGAPVIVCSAAEKARYPRLATFPELAPYDTLAALPIVAGADAIGVMGLAFRAAREFTATEVTLMATVAQVCGTTLQRVRLLEREKAIRIQVERQQEELRRTVGILTDTRKRYLTMLETNPDAIVVHQDRRIVFANAAAHRLLETSTPDRLLGQDILTIVHPDSRALVLERMQEIARTLGYNDFREQRWLTAGGRTLIVEAASAICEWQGRPAHQVVCRDVQARHEAAQRLAESERRFRFLVESIPHFVWSALPDGRTDYHSRQLREYLGTDGEESSEIDWLVPVHPDDREHCTAAWRTAHEHGTEFRIEYRIRRGADGQYRWFLGHALPLRDEEGRIVRWYGTCTDIHERKLAETELRRLQDMVQAIFAHAPAAMWVKDIQRRYMLVNQKCTSLMGFAAEEVVGKSNDELGLSEDTIQVTRESDEGVLQDRQPRIMEYGVDFGDGHRTLLASRFPLLAPDGSVEAIGGIVLDVSEHKELEHRLLQSQKMEGIGRLAGGIAHDFNNLLSVILGYAEMVEMELGADSPLAASVRNIQTAATRAASLTRQLLAFARRQATEPRVIDLNALLDSLTAVISPLIGEHITLDSELAADLGRVKADPNQLEQIVVNLAINARDAMPRGGSLRISTHNVTLAQPTHREDVLVPPGDYVAFVVTDTGTGISAEARTHLFEPFYSTKAIGKGTGLGLATCYGIVKQHRGFIWIASQEGRGTAVTVYLPRVLAETTREEPAARPSAPGGTETILVVEDQPQVRELAVTALRASGYTVLQAADGEQALTVAGQHSGTIDLLLTDMVMPRMGGPELSERIRRVRPDIRVLFASGYSEELFGATPEPSLGTLPLLQKPFTPSELLARVRQAMTT